MNSDSVVSSLPSVEGEYKLNYPTGMNGWFKTSGNQK